MTNNIKLERKARKIKLDEFAEFTGYSVKAIITWENGTREPNLKTLIKIADFFGVSLDYLLGRTSIRTFLDDKLSREELIEQIKEGTSADVTPVIAETAKVPETHHMSDSEFDRAVAVALKRLLEKSE